MFCRQEAFAQQTLQNGFDAWSMYKLKNKQMRLQYTEHSVYTWFIQNIVEQKHYATTHNKCLS